MNVSHVPSRLVLLIDLPSFKSTYKLTDANIVALADLIHDGKVNNLDLHAIAAGRSQTYTRQWFGRRNARAGKRFTAAFRSRLDIELVEATPFLLLT